jgi:hypothetical protein
MREYRSRATEARALGEGAIDVMVPERPGKEV